MCLKSHAQERVKFLRQIQMFRLVFDFFLVGIFKNCINAKFKHESGISRSISVSRQENSNQIKMKVTRNGFLNKKKSDFQLVLKD